MRRQASDGRRADEVDGVKTRCVLPVCIPRRKRVRARIGDEADLKVSRLDLRRLFCAGSERPGEPARGRNPVGRGALRAGADAPRSGARQEDRGRAGSRAFDTPRCAALVPCVASRRIALPAAQVCRPGPLMIVSSRVPRKPTLGSSAQHAGTSMKTGLEPPDPVGHPRGDSSDRCRRQGRPWNSSPRQQRQLSISKYMEDRTWMGGMSLGDSNLKLQIHVQE